MKRALCMGVNYVGTSSELSGCLHDAEDWTEALSARGFEVSQLLESHATLAGMREGLTALVESAKDGDSLVVTYSGHGTFVPDEDGDEPDGFDEALCPYDVAEAGPLIDDEIAGIFALLAPGARLVLISDSCHSGTVARFAGLGRGDGGDRVRFMPPATFRAALEDVPGAHRVRRARALGRKSTALLLSGCQDSEYAYDAVIRGRPNGAFTRAALDTLPPPGTARMSYRTWMREIRRLLPSPRHPQSPNLTGPFGSKFWQILE